MATGAEFTRLWDQHEVGLDLGDRKTIVHPELGQLQLRCQALLAPDRARATLIFTAAPGTESYEKLKLLAVLGAQTM
jgi:hypothetical protein